MTQVDSRCSGKHFNVGITKTALGMTYDKLPNGQVVNVTGYEYQVLQTLAVALNFSYSLVDMSHDPFGSLAENGTWLGSIGAIHRKKLDFAISCLTVTPERMEVVDFSPPYLVDRVSFFVQPQKLLRNNGIYFLQPFSGLTWLLLFVSLIIYSSLLQALLDRKRDRTGRGFLFVVGTLLYQDYKIRQWVASSTRNSAAILVVFWLSTSTVVTLFYGCSLTASTSASNPSAINKLNQLIPYFQSGSVQIGALDGSSYLDYLMHGVLSKLGGECYRHLALPIRDDELSYIDLLRKGKLVYLVGAKYFITLMQQEGLSDQYHEVHESLYYESLGIAQRKEFPCRKDFVRVINVLRETGCLDKWEQDLMKDHKSTVSKRKVEEMEVVTLIDSNQLDGTFLLWFSGLLISFLAYNCERALKLYRNRELENKPKRIRSILKKSTSQREEVVKRKSRTSRRRRRRRTLSFVSF